MNVHGANRSAGNRAAMHSLAFNIHPNRFEYIATQHFPVKTDSELTSPACRTFTRLGKEKQGTESTSKGASGGRHEQHLNVPFRSYWDEDG